MRAGTVGMAAWVLVAGLSQAQAQPLVVDDFNDGVLDPAWTIAFQDATGWWYEEANDMVAALDIFPAVEYGDVWSRVFLTRPVPPTGDFSLTAELDWDSEGQVEAMQRVGVALLDGAGNQVATIRYADPYVVHAGWRVAGLGENDLWTGSQGELPLAGGSVVRIDRQGEQITFTWDAQPLPARTSGTPVEAVRIYFDFYSHSDFDGTSFLGTLGVGHIELTPEPGSLGLLAVIGPALLRRRRGRGGAWCR